MPYTTFVGPDNTPDFKVNDIHRTHEAMRESLCVLCGERIVTLLSFVPYVSMWFFGGPKSMESRVFSDGPMHPECAKYAIAVCPYLRLESLGHRDAPAKHDGQPGVVITYDGKPEPRPRMGILKTNGYVIVSGGGTTVYWRANNPVEPIDWDTIPNLKE